jgi:hypothetical protein
MSDDIVVSLIQGWPKGLKCTKIEANYEIGTRTHLCSEEKKKKNNFYLSLSCSFSRSSLSHQYQRIRIKYHCNNGGGGEMDYVITNEQIDNQAVSLALSSALH